MDAVILAAGYGSRLRELSDSKPLARIAGVSLIEIAVRQLAAAGARRVIVVTGHRADLVEAALPAIALDAGVAVEARRIDDWSRPNGHSVIAGARGLPGEYLLVMADHLLSDDVLRPLAAAAGNGAGLTLAIDRAVDGAHVDPDDATWVQTDGDGRIKAIGKTIDAFDAVDCGAFLATAELVPAIEAAIAAGQPGSLSDGVQQLADRGRATTVDIGTGWWLDVDDPRAHAIAEAQVRAALPRVFATAEPRAAA